MKMWPKSRNPIVQPPEARDMSGRPPKNRRREIGEVRKAGKLSRMGTVRTCSICKGPNHNKRNCPKNPKHKSTPTPTTQEFTTGKKRGRGHYERASTSKTGTRRGTESGYKKRPKVVRQGVFVVDTVCMCINGLKWKGKQAMTQRELQVKSVMRRIQTRSKVDGIQTRSQAKGKSPSKKTS
ncbi:hypothetical protein EJD97_007307 [Solanum chilense]|uniref:Uncharacterized protein n=1 Tax=Solanum chilense TaxID=4083 RepID=A0A6N2CEF0_SOLCI|nr:hypothetical protein EJD97_007307 [Solanum chilense]